MTIGIAKDVDSIISGLNNKADLDLQNADTSSFSTKEYVDTNITETNEKVEEVDSKFNTEYLTKLVIASSPRWYKRMELFTPNKTTITIPAKTQVNIGEKGYISVNDTVISLDTVATAANRKGKDIYVYACAPVSGTEPVFVLSLNSTVPSGYSAENSRKIGGFHCLCADVGTIEGHTLSGYVAGDILPLSVWDLLHRPVSDPEGMICYNNTWFDIYLASWTGSKMVSQFNSVIADGASSTPFHGERFVEYLGLSNKRPIKRDEFVIVAKGSNENTNIANSFDSNTTGGHTDTNGRRMISNYGLEDCCGVLWQFTSDIWGHSSANNTSAQNHQYSGMEQTVDTNYFIVGYNWNNKSVHAKAIDGDTQLYGSAYGALTRCHVGGRWDYGSDCGSRCVHLSDLSSGAWSTVGVRGASESLCANL